MITLQEFQETSWEDMEEQVREYAVLIAKRVTGEKQYLLYQYNYFYVELEFFEQQLLTNIKSFDDLELLQPYLENIDIEEI